MKILHIGPKNYPPAHGGVEKVVFDLVTGLNKADSHVLVEWVQEEKENIKVLPKGYFKQLKFVLSYAKQKKISVLHFHKELFVLQAVLAKFLGYKTIVTIHGCPWRVKKWNFIYRCIFYFLDLLACAFVDEVVFVSKRDTTHFSRIFFWKKINFIPNGIAVSHLSCSEDTKQCVFIGRISIEKNVLELIKAFRDQDKVLTIYGPLDSHNQNYGNAVLTEIKDSINVSYGGVLPFSKVIKTLSKYNTFYNLSSSEGMPVAVLEAASIGMNLVLSDIPQHRDLGFIDVKYVNLNNIRISKSTVFKGSSKLNKNHTEKVFTISETAKKYKKLYEKLMRNTIS